MSTLTAQEQWVWLLCMLQAISGLPPSPGSPESRQEPTGTAPGTAAQALSALCAETSLLGAVLAAGLHTLPEAISLADGNTIESDMQ